ncbi:Response regulator, partial [Pseudomonas cichorii]
MPAKKRPALAGRFSFRGLRFVTARELPCWRSHSIWQLATLQRYACRNKGRVGIPQFTFKVNTPAGASMSKVSVLVVDDATFIRDLVKKGLRNYFPGIHTEDAVNGRKAQALLVRETFDLILCDWEMPEMSGLELLAWCREQDSYLKTVPFIMVTSRGDKENVVQAIQAGVTDFVGKPFTNEQLLTKVKKALAKVGKLDLVMSSAPARMNSPLNDSLSALTGGKAEVVRSAAPAQASAGIAKAPP